MRKAEVCPQNFLSWLPDEQVLAPLMLLLSSWLGGRRRPHLEQLGSPVLAGCHAPAMLYDMQLEHIKSVRVR